MANPYFQFKAFTVYHDRCAMKVTTDGCLFGAWVAARLQATDGSGPALDIGTGTGLLSLMVAQQHPVTINAIEIEPGAAQQARENVAASPWPERIIVLEGNVLDHDLHYPIIFSNPPFYENELAGANAQKNTAHHGEGLRLQDLFHFIATHLEAEGRAYLLLPSKRAGEIESGLAKEGLFLHHKTAVHQTPAHAAFRWMLELRTAPGVCTEERIIIRDEAGAYTPAFTKLLAPYYLHLQA